MSVEIKGLLGEWGLVTRLALVPGPISVLRGPCTLYFICMGYWPSVRSRWLDIGQVLFCVFMDRDGVEVHKLAKKERGQYPAILTEQTWSIKDLLYGFW